MQRALVVSHEGVLWEARHLLEHVPVHEMDRLLGSEDPTERIHNCQVIHYTRRDPSSGKLSAHLDWVRSICPWDRSLSSIVARYRAEDVFKRRADRDGVAVPTAFWRLGGQLPFYQIC